MRTKRLNNKGFTLVEVIVVAVIVAVLALVAIQLYTGYVREARINTAENLAAAAAGFLQSAYNSGTDVDEITTTQFAATTGAKWTDTTGANDKIFQVPSNAKVTITDTLVKAQIGTEAGDTSKSYPWK